MPRNLTTAQPYPLMGFVPLAAGEIPAAFFCRYSMLKLKLNIQIINIEEK